jgi:hypothetical protein
MRLYLLSGATFQEDGFEQGYLAGREEGYFQGYGEGEQDGFGRARTNRVYVGVWLDETVALDLGTSLRIVAASTTREGALNRANAYRDRKGMGAAFAFSFDLHHDDEVQA